MGKFPKILIIILVTIFILPINILAANDYPSPTDIFFVNDYAGVLQQDVQRQIAGIGKQLEDKTGAQVVVVTIDSLDGQEIEDYAVELGRKWGIGQKGKDNGVLFLIAVGDRKIDIEVGYGLEGAIPDIRAKEIIRENIKPYLKNDDYNSGVVNGYIALVRDVAKEYGAAIDEGGIPRSTRTPDSSSTARHSKGIGLTPFMIIAFLIFDGVLFRFRITSTLLKIIFWSNIFRGGRGGGGGWGGSGGGWGGGSSGGGSSGGGGSFGGGGSSDSY